MKKIIFVIFISCFFALPQVGLAVLDTEGNDCIADSDCTPPVECNPATWKCQLPAGTKVGDPCSASAPCNSPLICDAKGECANKPATPPKTQGPVAGALGAACPKGTAAECQSGYCNPTTKKCENKPAAPASSTNKAATSAASSSCKPIAAGLVPVECQCDATGCTLDSIKKAIANVAQFILGSIGGLALLMFVYGGLMYIIGGAVASQTNKAKDIMKYAAEGLIIVMLSGVILKVILKALL